MAGAHHDHVDDDVEEESAGRKSRLRSERDAVVSDGCERETTEVKFPNVKAERRLSASL